MRLGAELRAELEAVKAAAFANPFSPARQDLDQRMAGGPSTPRRESLSPAQRQAAFERRHGRLRKSIDALGGASIDLAGAGARERELIEPALLFYYQHELWNQLTTLHERGPAKEGQSVRAEFVRPVLAALVAHGIHEARAARLVAMFWQIWRAYEFIDRGLVGRSPSMIRLRERLWNSVFGSDLALYEQTLLGKMEDFSTILLGATGTGKGAAAAAIGHSGFIPLDDRGNAFVACHHALFLSINPSQYAEGLLESELFGHRRGSFTGAIDSHVGLLAKSTRYGTVFIDEIGEISTALQIKLLKVLQERTFNAVGSHDSLRFSGRVLAATHRDLAALRDEGNIRDDFYYRLCGEIIELPRLATRLQEREAELAELVDSLLTRSLGPSATALTSTVCTSLDLSLGPTYPWPGNVRELEQAVRRVLLVGTYEGDPRLNRAQGTPPSARAVGAGGSQGHGRARPHDDALDSDPNDPSPRLASPWANDVLGLMHDHLTHKASEDGPSLVRLQVAYFQALYQRHQSYERVARIAGVDRRTVRRFVHPAAD